jgi:hypothetical protein
MHKLIGSVVAAALLALPALAVAEAPTAEQVKAVWEFYEKGKGQGLVLGDAKLCTDVAKTGDMKAECTVEVTDAGVKPGTLVYVWQAYVVPKGDEISDVTIVVKQGETIRETKDVATLKGDAWRVRTWQGISLRKAGTWTINIQRGDKTLKSFNVKVQ